MRWEEWKFSAQLSAQDRFIRWTVLTMAILMIGMSVFFLWRLLPEGWRSGVITYHYNVYLGIDDVRSWPWLFFWPGIAVGMAMTDLVFALGLYRRNALASRTILGVGLVATILWAVGSFFLILVNV